MMAALPDETHLHRLVETAVTAERHHDIVNETKLRAAAQVTSYDEFHAAVLAAELTPVNLRETPLDQIAKPRRDRSTASSALSEAEAWKRSKLEEEKNAASTAALLSAEDSLTTPATCMMALWYRLRSREQGPTSSEL